MFPKDWTDARSVLGSDGLLSILLPSYNLGSVIEENLRRCREFFADHIPVELIPIDDGSTDDTAAALRRAAAVVPGVRPVFLPKNSGKGAALRAGCDAARGSYILLLDGDLDLPPDPIPLFFTILRRKGADVVIGSKMHPASEIDYPLRRRIASAVYYGLVKILVHLPVHDTQTGMKLFRADVLRYAFDRMLSKRFAFDLEVLSIARNHGAVIAEAPVKMEFGNKAGCLTVRNVRETLNDTLAVFYRLRVLRYYDAVLPLPAPERRPTLSVLIACPGPSAMLDDCVAALAAQDPRPTEALILPDAPTGRTWPDFVREIPTGTVRPAEKRNLGLENARGEIIAFLDDDAAPLPGWTDRALRHFAAHPEIAGVGGPAVTPPSDPFLAGLSGRVLANPLVSGAYRRRYTPALPCREEDIPSCNLFVRADTMRELGGFDTRHWPGEDTLLCQSIVCGLHKTLWYDPWIQVTHRRRPLFGPHLRQIGRYALHRGVFARRFPETSRKVAYFVPSLFLVGLVLGPPLCRWSPPPFRSPLCWTYAGVVGLYLLLVLATTFTWRVHVWLLSASGVVATHLVYGARFLRGLFGAKLPSDVRAFDHRG